METLPLDIENIIYDYKFQLELTEKFDKVMKDIDNLQIIQGRLIGIDEENDEEVLINTITMIIKDEKLLKKYYCDNEGNISKYINY